MSNNQIAIYNLICRESLTSTVKMICENISRQNIYKYEQSIYNNQFFIHELVR